MKRNFNLFYDVDEGMSGFGGNISVEADDVFQAMEKAKDVIFAMHGLPPTAEVTIMNPDDIEFDLPGF